ncbi:copper amine oxidase N-terminal domain-containing protein [Cohnella caldifontis]|uniref:copper amine oxidase N-terminal domain-containing protein n=1 Tax=Cohnella caldifontis TaxID=3027471 RepID=UPI0023EB8B7B|nr:copper amine oxidase N-terminal domain-containing protein [Cohnella sp. YIM B05605]
MKGSKVVFALILIMVVSVWSIKPAFADSPVTSTEFYKAYLDEEIVQTADKAGGVTKELAEYLADESAPLDIRAAVINAIGWEGERKGRTEAYVQYAYGKELSELDLSELRGDELFVIGYLLAMDDYFDTARAEELLRNAKMSMKDSFTAAMIHAIVLSQSQMASSWQEVWKIVAAVAFDERLNMDMRPEAAEIIIDYLVLYSDKKVINPFSSESRLTLRIGEPTFTLNGETFEIDPGYGTKPVLREGRAYLPVRFLAEAVGGTVQWHNNMNKVTVMTARTKLELTIGSPKVLVNGEERNLDSAPFLSGNRTMLPFRFIGEALGFDVSWNGQTKEIGLTLVQPKTPKG